MNIDLEKVDIPKEFPVLSPPIRTHFKPPTPNSIKVEDPPKTFSNHHVGSEHTFAKKKIE
jgi:hypothetical protein